MSEPLLKINPPELKFAFELKKQSSCAIHLTNVSNHYVAFKVKTTSPKKYCVRPNTGIIKPKSICDFTVTMQAQRSAPSDMECKDRFLIQSTVVPFGTAEDDITSDLFLKDSGKLVEENKLKVVLISPPNSPVLLQFNRVMEQETSNGTSINKDKMLRGDENLPPHDMLVEDIGFVKTATNVEELELELPKDVEDKELSPNKNVLSSPVKEVKPNSVEDVEDIKLKLTNEYKELKLRADALEYKLSEAKSTISELNYQNSTISEAKETLKLELARRKNDDKRIQARFSFLFVCMVALIGLTIGYHVHT